MADDRPGGRHPTSRRGPTHLKCLHQADSDYYLSSLQDAKTHHQGSFGRTGLFKRDGCCTILVQLERGDPARS